MSDPRAPDIRLNTPEEEEAIQREIAANPDCDLSTPPLPIRRLGRPRGSAKTAVNVRLDNDIISTLKRPDEKGWQTRLNDTLRRALGI